MKRWHGRHGRHAWLVLALVLVFGQVSTAHAGAIYKCVVKGATVYRDQPCSTARPEMGRLYGPAGGSDDPAVGNDPAALMQGIRTLGERDRQLQTQHDRELDQLKLRMIGVHDEQVQRREVGGFNLGWQERFAENRRKRQALVDRLKALCPGGASGNAQGHTCHRRGSDGAGR